MPPTENQPELIELPPEAQPFSGDTPANLVFDDEPLDHLLYGAPPVEPSPVNALEIWKRNLDRSPACARAVAAAAANNTENLPAADLEVIEECLRSCIASDPPIEASQRALCHLGLARSLMSSKKMEEAESCCREALNIYEATLGLAHEQTQHAGNELGKLLVLTRREEEAGALAIRLELGLLEGKDDEYSLYKRRCLALRMFQAGQYAQAETAYRYLIEKRFETPTNHCHLARVLLMTDRIEEAHGEVNRAWEVHDTGPAYVIPRIHFMKALMQMLVRGDWNKPLTDLKQVMAKSGNRAEWIIQPVLDHLKSRLEPDAYQFMSIIGAAVRDCDNQPQLDACEAWKNIVVESQTSAPLVDKPEDPVPF